MRLSKQSPLPSRHRGRTVIAEYESPEIEEQVLHELLGKPVIADLRVVEYVAMTSALVVKPPYPLIESIKAGRPYEELELFWDEEDELGEV